MSDQQVAYKFHHIVLELAIFYSTFISKLVYSENMILLE